jgi:glycosyltransferase involved in cell wall biosynthesis
MLSIITVSYNSASTLARTFDSVLSQNFNGEIEYIVIDGASTDDTVSLIRQYEGLFSSCGIYFSWISEPDKGIYDAMNKGITMANGELVGILNSDDFYEPDTLKRVSEAAGKSPDADIIYGMLRVMLADGRELQIYRYRYDNYLLDLSCTVQSAAQHPTCFVRKRVYDEIGCFDTSFRTSADYDFLLRAMKNGVSFLALDHVLSNFSLGGATDHVDQYDMFEQRWRAQYKNGLLTEKEYNQRKRRLRYHLYKRIKAGLVNSVFKVWSSNRNHCGG